MNDIINPQRLLADLYEQGKIGWVNGRGLTRKAYSETYIAARKWLKDKMDRAGLCTRIDCVGNLLGRLEGETEKTILVGSHLDSVENGGIYDGPLGIIAGLEIARGLKDHNIALNHSLEIVAFIGEEGEPLGGTFGSRTFTGLLPSDYRKNQLEALGITGNDIIASKCVPSNYIAFLELHIEQGPVLERKGIAIGVPSGIVGIMRLDVTVDGEANHAGTTPMQERKDALKSAVGLISKWFEWVDTQDKLVCNIGRLSITPGHVSVVPQRVTFTIEIRSVDDNVMTQAYDYILRLADDIAPCTASVKRIDGKPPVLLNNTLIGTICQCAERRSLSHIVMPSGASHDSSPLAHVMQTAMIFVPSHNGISHSIDEFTEEKDIVNGTQLLCDTVLALDKLKKEDLE